MGIADTSPVFSRPHPDEAPLIRPRDRQRAGAPSCVRQLEASHRDSTPGRRGSRSSWGESRLFDETRPLPPPIQPQAKARPAHVSVRPVEEWDQRLAYASDVLSCESHRHIAWEVR
jgi:hypothetical protein